MLLAGQETDDQFPGLEYFVRQLAAVSSDISIWMYADSVLKQDEALAAKIFMKQGMDVNSDGRVTRQEFVRSCINDSNLAQLLSPKYVKLTFFHFILYT